MRLSLKLSSKAMSQSQRLASQRFRAFRENRKVSVIREYSIPTEASQFPRETANLSDLNLSSRPNGDRCCLCPN
jgi:predicted NAD-dependent protein-ADP-ribosyltransferase YbiA (DUF1768 family)